MKGFREKIERGFDLYGKWLIRFRLLVVMLVVVLSAGAVMQLRHLTFDTTTEGFFREDDPALINYNAFRDQFGRDEMIAIAIEPDEIFSLSFLRKLKAFHEELEQNVPNLADINSLVDARLTRGEEGALVVKDLLEDFPNNAADLKKLKSQVMSNPLYQNLLISEDGKITTVIIKTEAFSNLDDTNKGNTVTDTNFEMDNGTVADLPRQPLSDTANSATVLAVKNIIKKYQNDHFRIYLAGSPVVTDYLKKAMQNNMKRFTGLALLSIGLFLFFLFRRFSGVLLPLLVVVLSVVCTLGLVTALGKSLKIPTMILPSFLLAVGVGASVHLMSIFFRYYTGKNQNEAISASLSHSGLPIVMTSITTAAGLASFIPTKMEAVADLGVMGSLGVMISLVLTLFLLPALLSFFPIKPLVRAGEQETNSRLDMILQGFGNFASDRPWTIMIVTTFLLLIAITGLFRLKFSHNTLVWFPKDSSIRRDTEVLDKRMKGSLALEVIVDTHKENGLYDPKLMHELDQFSTSVLHDEVGGKPSMVGKTITLSDMLKEINQALNENQPEFYSIPDNKKLIAQEFLLFENSGSDDLEDIVDSQFRKARFTAKVPWNDAATYVKYVNELQTLAKNNFSGQVDLTVTGLIVLFTQTIHAMMQSTVVSYSIAAVVITLLMILLIGRFRLGVLSMIPNLLPIVITLGFMGWVGIRLDMFTLLIGSIAIGLAVDDTIHFFHNFRKYYEQSEDARFAIRETLHTTGRAMLITSLVLTTGFWLFMFATLNNLFYFGLLTGMTLVLAFLADVILAPAMLTLLTKTNVGKLRK